MEIKSKGFLTHLMFARFSGSVRDTGSLPLIQTPTNPGYHWGNYIIFDRPPAVGDLKKWIGIFDQEFSYYAEPHHYTFAWEANAHDVGASREFMAAGFEQDSAVVLTAARLRAPLHLNKSVEIKKITTDQNWQDVVHLQNESADPKYLNVYYSEFKERQMKHYRTMSEAGKGYWFGAYVGAQLVADLGIFAEGGTGRYQSVETHRDFRRQGICGTLVYKAGQLMMQERNLKHLVMEADPEYHAARVYESVGFERNELNYSLSWWRSKGPLRL